MLLDDIKRKLEKAFPESLVEVSEFGSLHLGHGAVGDHIAVKVKYSGFNGKSVLDQHREVYAVLSEELKNQVIHALKIDTKE